MWNPKTFALNNKRLVDSLKETSTTKAFKYYVMLEKVKDRL